MWDHREWGQQGSCCCTGLIGFSPQSARVSAATVMLYHRSVFTEGPTHKSNIFELVEGFSSLYEYTFRTDREF